MQTRSGLLTRTGTRLTVVLAVLIATAGLMLAGGATPALAVAPSVTTLSPASCSAAGGATITITGTGFDANPNTSVMFGVTAGTSVNVTSTTSLSVVCPAHVPGVFNVVVTTLSNGASAGTSFTYTPVVTSISPANGPIAGGTVLTITGSGLSGGTVALGASTCNVTSTGPTQILCTTTAHAAGVDNVIVTVASITSPNTAADDFTYTATGLPVITTLTPNFGVIGGGNAITITGTNLSGTTMVT